MNTPRRRFLQALGFAPVLLIRPARAGEDRPKAAPPLDPAFLVQREELELDFHHAPGARRLSFAKHSGDPARWREQCRGKLAELTGISLPGRRSEALVAAEVKELRSRSFFGVKFRVLVMRAGQGLTVPAYLLEPQQKTPRGTVVAIQGHGEVEGVIGVQDDYHHRFGLELARAGFLVLCPALRGFGVLRDLAWATRGQRCLDYWEWNRGHQFTLVTDGFIHGRTLIGQTVEDLLRWEQWLCRSRGITTLDVAGISYGGDLAILYPVFSSRVRRIFASGTFGSFEPVFARCYNAPAHCIPAVLQWMDRSDIAGLNAPRPMALHYGQQDVPGPENNSASYNETVKPALRELNEIYKAFGGAGAVRLIVTPGRGHEMDLRELLEFLA
jgi:dienelactone hydrolase